MNEQILTAFLVGAVLAIMITKIRVLQTIVTHTLINPRTGEWSRKNLTGATSFAYSIYYCQSCVAAGTPINIEVLIIFNATALTCLGISSWEKVNVKKPAGSSAPDPAA